MIITGPVHFHNVLTLDYFGRNLRSDRRPMKRTRGLDCRLRSVKKKTRVLVMSPKRSLRLVNKRFLAVHGHVRRDKTLLRIKDTWIRNEGSWRDFDSIDHRPVRYADPSYGQCVAVVRYGYADVCPWDARLRTGFHVFHIPRSHQFALFFPWPVAINLILIH